MCWLEAAFSGGDFKSLGKASKPSTVKPQKEGAAEESDDEKAAKAIYSCPQEGCTRVFQRHAALEKHLSYERCTKSIERATLRDHAMKEYAAILTEGVGKIPVLPETAGTSDSGTKEPLKEGWALKEIKKPYRFNEKQKSYLVSKFNIGQDTGRKMDPEVVAREMRREKDPNGARLFVMSEFLTAQQISSFFSRLAAKIRQQPVGQAVEEEDIAAANDEENFANAREFVLATLGLVHPIVCDQQNLCEMVKAGSLSKRKLGQLQSFCSALGLAVPVPQVRRKAPYVTLLEEYVQGCSCMDSGSCSVASAP